VVRSAAPVDGALAWEPFPGAVDYVVVLAAPDGVPDRWEGREARAPVASAIDATFGALLLAAGTPYRWFVYGRTASGDIVASSEPQEFVCGSTCP
jgi:hypothetical protein